MKTCILYLLLGGLWISACNTQPETQAAIQETDSTRATSTQAHEAHADNHVELSAAQAKSINLQLGNMEQKNLSEVVKVSGKLDVPPQNLVTIHAPVSGFVKSTDLLQGMPVKKGQVIAILQNQDYVQIQQDYVESKSRLEFLEKEYQRQAELNRENVNSDKVFQQTQSDYKIAQARITSLEERMKLIGLDRKQALAGKFSTTIPIRTPISGYVTQVNVNLGKFVNSTDAMFEIVNTEHLHAELMVFEKDVIRIRKGQKIRFTLPNESNQQRQATVYLIGKEIDQNRAVRVHGHLDQEDTNLLPGMFINAVIEVSANTVSAVPEQAVVKSEGKQYIFVQRQGHEEQPNDKPRKEKATEEVQAGETTFEMIEVKTGVSDLGYVHITPLQEIPANGKIVIQGAFFLLSHKNNAEGGGEEHGH